MRNSKSYEDYTVSRNERKQSWRMTKPLIHELLKGLDQLATEEKIGKDNDMVDASPECV